MPGEMGQGSGGVGKVRAGRSEMVRRKGKLPAVEFLESRQLLSVFTGFSHVRNIATTSGIYSLQLSDQSVLKVSPAGNGQIDVKVLGTTTSSTLTITQVRPRYHLPNDLLSIRSLTIRSGQIGSILAAPVELDGTMTPLTSSVSTMDFGTLGPRAQIDVGGSVGAMSVGQVLLGPTGHVIIGGNLNGTTVTTNNSSTSASGTGSVTINGTVTGTITATGTGSGTAPTTPQTVGAITIGSMAMNGGEFVVVGDSVAPIQITNNMSLSENGLFSIGRDQTGAITVGGSLLLDSGGQLRVGRNLAGLTVSGDVQINATGSGILVGGDLDSMTVGGVFRGQNTPTAVDLAVGLNLNGLSVMGGGAKQGGIQTANINVGKSLAQLVVPHGIFQSWITAGVSISDVNVGADGVTAIYNSEIDGGTSTRNMVVGGDVKSGFPTGDSSGYRTRIIAGKIRAAAAGSTPDQGLYLPDGTIDQLVIQGSLINSVLATSVAPYGGDGSLPPPGPYGGTPRTSGPPPAGFSNYNAPGGLTDIGSGQNIKNYSIRSYVGGQLVPAAVYDTTTDPNIHVNVLAGGTVNATVTGSVVSTPHDDSQDFTGVFAVNTKGVNGGLAP